MSAATDCSCACPDPTVVLVPGAPGEPGEPCVPCADGISAFTLLTANLTIPASEGDPATLQVAENSWAAVGQIIFASDETDFGTFIVTGLTGTTVISANWLNAPGDAAGGSVIGSGGKVVCSGQPGQLTGAVPTVLTDNSTGTASNVIAVGAGQFTHSVYFRAAAITGNVLLYTYTPGFAFKILRISASVVDAITTGAKAATLTTAIAATPTTGGIVIMSGTYALGTEQASSAAITAANTGTSVQAITVTASAVTAFVEGGFMLHFQIQNLDSANAIASVAAKINAILGILPT